MRTMAVALRDCLNSSDTTGYAALLETLNVLGISHEIISRMSSMLSVPLLLALECDTQLTPEKILSVWGHDDQAKTPVIPPSEQAQAESVPIQIQKLERLCSHVLRIPGRIASHAGAGSASVWEYDGTDAGEASTLTALMYHSDLRFACVRELLVSSIAPVVSR